jgi:hypothetical protein
MPRVQTCFVLVFASLAIAAAASPSEAIPLSGSWRLHDPTRPVTIANDRGGYVVDYALQLHRWQQNGTRVRFHGRCQSACTLYLALPKNQTCIARGASFTFHAPSGSSPSASRFAKIYMNKTYPHWVRSWIASNGGLTRRLITMNYSYAAKFIATCDPVTASRASSKLSTERS